MDPDKDTVATRQLSRKQLLDTEHKLLLRVERLLDKANYFQVAAGGEGRPPTTPPTHPPQHGRRGIYYLISVSSGAA